MRGADPTRRHAPAPVTGVVTVLLSLWLAACSGAASSGEPTPTSAAGGTSRPAATTSPPTSPPVDPSTVAPTVTTAPTGPPRVAPATTTVEVDLTDTSRPTVSHGTRVAASRHLPTTVYLPADASGAPTGRSLPWLVFLHGFDVGPDTYDALLRTWAGAGYAVAAPLLPLTSDRSGPVQDEADMVNEPADVRFVITSLLARSARAGDPLSGRLDPRRIGVAGHSDGANVAFTAGFSLRFRDPRLQAVVDLSGELPTGMGPYDPRGPGPALLMVASDADGLVPLARSQELYDARCCHSWWVELHGASHLSPYQGPNDWSAAVDRVTVAFLDRTLGRFQVDPGAVAAAADSSPAASLHATTEP